MKLIDSETWRVYAVDGSLVKGKGCGRKSIMVSVQTWNKLNAKMKEVESVIGHELSWEDFLLLLVVSAF